MAETGANTIFAYRWEDEGAYAQDPSNVSDTVDKAFGANESVNDPEASNNPERLSQPFRRQSSDIVETRFEGSWGVDYTLKNPYWLQFVFGSPTENQIDLDNDGQTDEYEYVFEMNDPTSPPRSAQIIEETHYRDGSIDQTVYVGAIGNSVDVNVSVGGLGEISLGGLYAFEEFYEDASNSPYGVIGSQPDSGYEPIHYGLSNLYMDLDNDGTAERRSLVQDASLTFGVNAEIDGELGTRLGVTPSFLDVTPNLNYTTLVDAEFANDERKAMYGASGATSPQPRVESEVSGELEFADSQGAPDGALNVYFEIADAFPESFSRNNTGDPSSALEEQPAREVREVSARVETATRFPSFQ